MKSLLSAIVLSGLFSVASFAAETATTNTTDAVVKKEKGHKKGSKKADKAAAEVKTEAAAPAHEPAHTDAAAPATK